MSGKIDLSDKSLCCGCGACEQICPKGCISMIEDPMGFLYPKIDEAKCIDCGICSRVCAFKNDVHQGGNYSEPQTCYAAKAISAEVQRKTSSGGLAHLLLQQGYEDNMHLYGCVIADNRTVRHECLTDPAQADGSKYVQSDIRKCFLDITEKLKSGEKVLFVGVACQVAALRRYVSQKLRNQGEENLYTVDVLCHGVPSPGVLESFLRWTEKRTGSKVSSICFRSKEFGWTFCQRGNKLVMENGQEESLDLYFSLYFNHQILRPSCTTCPYKSMERVSDITLSDFWNIKKFAEDFYNPMGVSRVLINSEKGKRLFNSLCEQVECRTVPLENCNEVEQFQAPASVDPAIWDSFLSKYQRNSDKMFDTMYRKTAIRKTAGNILRKLHIR